jgi:NADH-quinone oxidoreductase subunit J
MALPDTVPYIGWRWDDLAFLLLAGVLLGAALMVVLGRNIIRSGLWLVLSFAGLAGIYALLGATLVAAAQVLIYIGAISVLILFALMLTQSKSGPARLVFHHQAWVAVIAAILLAILLVATMLFTTWPLALAAPVAFTAVDIADLMFNEYLLAFEVVSLLLLAAVIGGIYLAKRDDTPQVVEDEAVEPSPARPASGQAVGRISATGVVDQP